MKDKRKRRDKDRRGKKQTWIKNSKANKGEDKRRYC